MRPGALPGSQSVGTGLSQSVDLYLGGAPTALSPAHEVDQEQNDNDTDRGGDSDVAGAFGGLVDDSLDLTEFVL